MSLRVFKTHRHGGVGLFFGFVQQLEDPLCRRRRALQHVRDAGRLRDGHRELARVLDEGLHIAERDGAAGHPEAADDADGDVVEIADEVHHRLDHAGDELGL